MKNESLQDDNIKKLLRDAIIEISDLRKKVIESDNERSEPIAIVGIGCRFPGGNDSPDTFWNYLQSGQCSIREMKDERWPSKSFETDGDDTPGKISTSFMSLIDHCDQFDADLFKLPAAEAKAMDPQFRILLMVCHEALQNAGLDPDNIRGGKTGVFVGCSTNDYARLTMNHDVHATIDGYACLGSAASVGAGRISYLLDLNGPAITLDTSCSSSLLSVHLACESIRRGESDNALAGGVNLILTPENSIALSQMQALSPTGQCKTFDAEADGYVRGEGCGVVVLKSLSQAVEDGDDIYAVIEGSATNHDGASNGLTAPNGVMQEKLIQDALRNANVSANDIHYVEAHGTGTPLGDPIEMSALANVLRHEQPNKPLYIGSVKTNIGHLESAAGIAALIKLAMSIKKGAIPPHLHFNTPNPYIPWGEYNLNVPQEVVHWKKSPEQINYGAVSAFGLSGTNVHLIARSVCTDEYLEDTKPDISSQPSLLTFSARSSEALSATASRWKNFIKATDNSLEVICKNSQISRGQYRYRMVVSGHSKNELLNGLEMQQSGLYSENVCRGTSVEGTANVAMLFTGQGSQYINMGRELYDHEHIFREALDECDSLYQSYAGHSLLDILWGKSDRDIHNTQYTQPAIFSIQVGLIKLWKSKGLRARYIIGHSIGEYAGAYAAGVMSLQDAMRLVVLRGQLMVEMCETGGMLAVKSDAQTALALLRDHDPYNEGAIAAINSAQNIVIAAPNNVIDRIVHTLMSASKTYADIKHARLSVSHAFHSPSMGPMLNKFRSVVENVQLTPPQQSFYSTVTGGLVSEELCDPMYWSDQIASTVNFHEALLSLSKRDVSAYLEIGSDAILTSLASMSLELDSDVAICSLRRGVSDLKNVTKSLARLYVLGALDSSSITNTKMQRRLAIPAAAPVLTPYWCDFKPAYLNIDRNPTVFAANLITDWEEMDEPSGFVVPTKKCLVISTQNNDPVESSLSPQSDVEYIKFAFNEKAELPDFEALGKSSFYKVVIVDPEIDIKNINSICFSVLTLVNSIMASKILIDQGQVCFLSLPSLLEHPVIHAAPIISSLCCVLRHEYGALRFQRIELKDAIEKDFSELIGSLIYQTGSDESCQRVRFAEGKLYRPVLKEIFKSSVMPDTDTKKNISTVTASGSYLISGGVGALGLSVAEMLACDGAGQLILLSRRSELDEKTIKRIESIRSKGCIVNLISADVCALDDVVDQLGSYLNDELPLRGIVHCAGVLKDQLCAQTDLNSFTQVLEPKVKGTFNLHTLSLQHSLDFFVMFGSVASILGNAGQSAYAMANGFLESISHHRRALELPVQLISWGPWAGDGMVENETLKLTLSDKGFAPLAADDGIRRLRQCMLRSNYDPIVLDLITSNIHSGISQHCFPEDFKCYVNKYINGGGDKAENQVVDNGAISEFEYYINSKKPQLSLLSAIEYLRHEMRVCFGDDTVLVWPSTQPLSDLGFDSLMAVKLRNTLARTTNSSLPVSLLFDFPTIDSLAHHLLSVCFVESGPTVNTSEAIIDSDDVDEIAIIGVGCKLPGGIESPEEFWRVLEQGDDCVSDIGDLRWKSDLYFDENPDSPGKMYSRWGGLLDGVDQFDNTFFGISNQEAIMMDPQQRLLMEVSWQALENANIVASEQTDAGIFVGCGQNEYAQILRTQGLNNTNAYFGTGASISVTAGRLAYYLGWQGPAIAVDTACSSSLVSISMACDAIRNGDCGIALAGGVNLTLSPQTNIGLSKARMLSPVGRCKTFDNSADGYVRSEGCGLVVLKSHKLALRDGDNILAVIKASGVNHDGRSQGLTAPNGPSQVRLMERVLRKARVSADEVQYVEAHGTGTPLGDPIEMNSIERAYLGERKVKLYVGSVKTNIGHTEACAGVASLIKVVLMLQHEKIVKNVHLQKLNEHFSEAVRRDDGLIDIPKEALVWPENIDNKPRYAAVSSFGFSGTNAHLILMQPNKTGNSKVQQEAPFPSFVLPVSGRSISALRDNCQRYVEYLSNLTVNQDVSVLSSVCYAASCKREHFEYRLGVCADDMISMISKLTSNATTGLSETKSSVVSVDKYTGLAFMFTGQGSQYLGMGKALAETAAVFRNTLEECDQLMRVEFGESIIDIIWGQDSDAINNTYYTQPALFVFEYALAKQWQSWGVEPEFVLGHSVGEYAAACLAGVFSLPDAIKLVCARARLMVEHCDTGAMLVLFCDSDNAQGILERLANSFPDLGNRLSIAAENTPTNTVISGGHEAIFEVEKICQLKGVHCQALSVSHGFHSVLMEPMLAEFKSVVDSINFQSPRIRFISTVTGEELSSECCQADYWVKHVHQCVRFHDAVQNLALKSNAVLEIGPGSQLVDMAKRCLPSANIHYLFSMKKQGDGWSHMMTAISKLYQGHVPIDWKKIYSTKVAPVGMVPNYAFQRKSIWPALPGVTLFPSNGAQPEKNLTHVAIENPLGKNTTLASGGEVFETQAAYHVPFDIEDHRLYDTVVLPGASHLAMTAYIGESKNWSSGYEIFDVLFPEAMIFNEYETKDVQYLVGVEEDGQCELSAYSRIQGKNAKWITHYTAKVRMSPLQTDNKRKFNFNPDGWKIHLAEEISGDMFYREMSLAGYKLKNSFRWIESVWRKPGASLTKLRAPSGATEKSYPFYPGLMDAFFQSTAAANEDAKFNLRDKEDIFIPIAVDAMGIYGKATDALWCYVEQADNNSYETYIHRIWVFSESGECLLWVDALRSKRAPKDVLLKSLSQRDKALVYDIRREASPLNTVAIDKDKKNQSILVVGYQPHQELVQLIEEAGSSCCVLDLSVVDFDVNHVDINADKNRESIFSNIKRILRGNTVTSVISLCGTDYFQGNEFGEKAFACSQNSIIQPNIFVYQYLLSIGQEPSWILAALETNKNDPPVSSTLIGFSRVMRNESSHGEICFLSVRNAEFLETAVMQELTLGNHEPDVYYDSNGKRYVSRFYPSDVKHNVTISPHTFSEDKIYIITGGLGGIGLSLTEFLIRHGARKIVLTTRRCPDEIVNDRLSRFNSGGVSVSAIQCDISKLHDVQRMISEVKESAPIDGIFHCAGVLNDGLISHQGWQDFQVPLSAKVNGSWWLHESTKDISLSWFVLFSSAATTFGSAGQSNYAAANSFMDELAEYRQQTNLPALSVNWGPWAGDGMASSAVVNNNLGRTKGLRMLDAETAFTTMVVLAEQQLTTLREMSPLPRKANFTVIDIDWDLFSGTLAHRLSETLFHPVSVSDTLEFSSSMGMAFDVSKFKRDINAVKPDERFEFVLTAMMEATNELMALDRNNYINPEEALQNLGFDSLMALELRNVIGKTLEKNLPATLLFDMPTLDSIVQFMLSELFEVDTANVSIKESVIDRNRVSHEESIDLDVDVLSDDDLARLLEEEIS